jgi:hypothetical protein
VQEQERGMLRLAVLEIVEANVADEDEPASLLALGAGSPCPLSAA